MDSIPRVERGRRLSFIIYSSVSFVKSYLESVPRKYLSAVAGTCCLEDTDLETNYERCSPLSCLFARPSQLE